MSIDISTKRIGAVEEITISNGVITVSVIPEYGGRIIEFSRDGCNVLYRNNELLEKEAQSEAKQDWCNYGGYKAWLAPQTKWMWPPIYELDTGAYTYETVELEEGIKLRLESSLSGTYGIRMVREITVLSGCDHIMVKDSIINMGSQPIEWGLWGNMQVAAPGVVKLRMHTDKYIGGLQLYQLFDFPPDNAIKRLADDPCALYIGTGKLLGRFKIGTITDNAEIVYLYDAEVSGVELAIEFAFEGNGTYANNCNIEIYNDGEVQYAELEVLGRINNLRPGESRDLEQKWMLRQRMSASLRL